MSELALPAPVASRPGLGSTLERVRQVAAQPAVAKSLPMIGLVAILGLAAMIWLALSQPPQRELFRGLADGDKAAVVDTLKASNIAYSIDRDTGALSVSEGDFYNARMLLAQQGLPKSAPDGNEMISSLPLGASRAVEGERLRGARELDLARTIEAIDAIESAKVHLAVEQPSVFLRDRSEPAASVMLRLQPGRTLGDAQVQAIVHLVASSVSGLAPEDVSVVDQAGRLLSRSGGDAAGNASERQIQIQAQIEARYLESIRKLLTPIVGADNFAAEVHADVDFAEVQATRESYPKDLGGLRQEEGSITNDGGAGGEAGGIPGALSNQPPPTPAAAPVAGQPGALPAPATTASNKSENYNRTFQLGREVSVTKNPVGTVKRLTVAVALKQGKTRRTAKEIAEIQQLVQSAVGFDAARGDTIALNARKFADPSEADAASGPSWWEAGWVSMLARNLSALLIAALIVFGVAKPLMKRRAEAAAARPAAPAKPSRKAAIGSEIAAVMAQEVRQDPTRPVTLDMIEAAPGYANRAALIRSFVRQDPARAALVVRDLIRSDMPGGEDA